MRAFSVQLLGQLQFRIASPSREMMVDAYERVRGTIRNSCDTVQEKHMPSDRARFDIGHGVEHKETTASMNVEITKIEYCMAVRRV